MLLTGDAEKAHAEFREVWSGGLCVRQRDAATEQDVRAAQDAVNDADIPVLDLLYGGCGRGCGARVPATGLASAAWFELSVGRRGAGVVLGLPLITDDVVNEEVVRVAIPPAEAPAAPEGPRIVAQGSFEAVDHPGAGEATVIETGEGEKALSLTDLKPTNGLDLFVTSCPKPSSRTALTDSLTSAL